MSNALKVSVELNGKKFERAVVVEVDKKDKGFCRGKVGDFFFYWRPEKFELPMLNLKSEQYKALYKGLMTSEEKEAKMEATRKLIKKFLVAYKQLKQDMKTTELHGTIPVIPKVETVPEGFELVGEHMFGVDNS